MKYTKREDVNIEYKFYDLQFSPSDEIYKGIAKLRWNTQDKDLEDTILDMKQRRKRMYYPGETSWFEIVVTDENNVIGFCRFEAMIGNIIYWHHGDLKVKHTHRRQGIATTMIKKGIEEANKRGGIEFQCEIKEKDTESIKFHQSLGFKDTNTLKSFNRLVFPRDSSTYTFSI